MDKNRKERETGAGRNAGVFSWRIPVLTGILFMDEKFL